MTPEENIKGFLEQITGSELSLKKLKKSEEDFRRALFEQIILSIERVNNRSLIMEKEFEISHFKYDETFHEIIDSLLLLCYGEDATNLILFYLYERKNANGSINEVMNDANNPVPLNNPTELYYAIKDFDEPKKKKKK